MESRGEVRVWGSFDMMKGKNTETRAQSSSPRADGPEVATQNQRRKETGLSQSCHSTETKTPRKLHNLEVKLNLKISYRPRLSSVLVLCRCLCGSEVSRPYPPVPLTTLLGLFRGSFCRASTLAASKGSVIKGSVLDSRAPSRGIKNSITW